MKKQREDIIRDLVESGCAFMPIDVDLYESADSAARIFLLAHAEHWADWNFVRDDGTSLGIVEDRFSQMGVFPEKKRAFVFAHDLPRRRIADSPHTKACLGAVNELYRDMRRRITDLCYELDRYCGCEDLVGRVRKTFELGDERATSLHLRSSVCGTRTLTNALQADSVLTACFASDDSEVWAKNEAFNKWELRSPPYGTALIFFGQKVNELQNDKLRPALYRVDAHGSRPVCATVMHVQIKELQSLDVQASVAEPILLK
jgi:hypothetical protein